MISNGQPIRDSVPRNSRCTKDPRWLNNVFLFITKIRVEQIKKHPVWLSPCSHLSEMQRADNECSPDTFYWKKATHDCNWLIQCYLWNFNGLTLAQQSILLLIFLLLLMLMLISMLMLMKYPYPHPSRTHHLISWMP